jgi:uncharacterized protein (TIGR02246 family)
MAKFTAEQAHAYVEIQQLIHDWAFELDHHNGKHIADLVTEDCVYVVGGAAQQGREAAITFYEGRNARLAATPEGVPVHRHSLANLRAHFRNHDEASITFNLTYFSTFGNPKGTDHADPLAYADVRMDVRRDADGHWRIAMFDSNQSFRKVIG